MDGLWFKEQAPNMQTQHVPQYVNYPKHLCLGDGLGFQDNSSNVAFDVKDVYNPNQNVPSDHRALFFSSNPSEDAHLPRIDHVIDDSSNMLGGSTLQGFHNLGLHNYLDMDCRNVLGHVEVKKHDQFRSRGRCFDSIMAQPATRVVDHLGSLQVPTTRNMNSYGLEHCPRQILSRNFKALAASPECTTGSNGHKGQVCRNSTTTSPAPKKVAPAKNTSKNSTWIKGQWSSEEDNLLVRLVEQHGVGKWSQIAQSLNGRMGKQCRDRWNNHLRPNIEKDTIWTEEEDMALIRAHMECGNKWAVIAKRLPRRPENSIKNHWHTTQRRSDKCRSSSRPITLLQNYIKSLGLPNPKLAQTQGPTNSPTKPTKMGIEEMPGWDPLSMGPLAPIDDGPVGHVDEDQEDWALIDEIMMSLMPHDPPSLHDDNPAMDFTTTNSPTKPTKMGIEEMPRWDPLSVGPLAPIDDGPVGHVDEDQEDWALIDEIMMSLMPHDPPSLHDDNPSMDFY